MFSASISGLNSVYVPFWLKQSKRLGNVTREWLYNGISVIYPHITKHQPWAKLCLSTLLLLILFLNFIEWVSTGNVRSCSEASVERPTVHIQANTLSTLRLT